MARSAANKFFVICECERVARELEYFPRSLVLVFPMAWHTRHAENEDLFLAYASSCPIFLALLNRIRVFN
jgi:hypothetical protein